MLMLGLVFILVTGLIVAVTIRTISENRTAITAYTEASQNALRGETVNRYLVTIAVGLRAMYAAKSPDEARTWADRVDQTTHTLDAFLDDWSRHVPAGQLPELDAVKPKIQLALSGSRNLARLARDVSPAAADAAGNHDSYRVGRETMQGRMDAMIARLTDRVRATQAALDRFQSEGIRNALLTGGAGIVALLGVSLFMALGMAAQLRTVRRSIVAISEGAYDTQLPSGVRNDEISAIWDALDILKLRAAEAQALSRQKLEDANRLRELVLD